MDAKQKLAEAVERADQDGFERDDGRWVDPPTVQKAAIEIGFANAAKMDGFDIWTVVNPSVAIRDGQTLAENFERVYDQYSQVAESDEIKGRIQQLIEDAEQEG